MADSHPDTALDALLARYVPGSMLDSAGTSELVAQVTRLRTERDQAVHERDEARRVAAMVVNTGAHPMKELAKAWDRASAWDRQFFADLPDRYPERKRKVAKVVDALLEYTEQLQSKRKPEVPR